MAGQILSDNIQVNAPKPIDNKWGVFSAGKWRPFNNVAEFDTLQPPLSQYETQMFWVRNPVDEDKSDLYALDRNKVKYKLIEDVDLSDYYTVEQINDLLTDLQEAIPEMSPVQTVNGRIGDVTGLVEELSLNEEISQRIESDQSLQLSINKAITKVSSTITASAGQTVFVFPDLIGQFPFSVNRSGLIEYTREQDNVSSDPLKKFSFNIITGEITLPVGLSSGEFVNVQYTGLGNPSFVPDSVAFQSDLDEIDERTKEISSSSTLDYSLVLIDQDNNIGFAVKRNTGEFLFKELFSQFLSKLQTAGIPLNGNVVDIIKNESGNSTSKGISQAFLTDILGLDFSLSEFALIDSSGYYAFRVDSETGDFYCKLADSVVSSMFNRYSIGNFNKFCFSIVDDDFNSAGILRIETICDELAIKATFGLLPSGDPVGDPDADFSFSSGQIASIKRLEEKGYQMAMHPVHEGWYNGSSTTYRGVAFCEKVLIKSIRAFRSAGVVSEFDYLIYPGSSGNNIDIQNMVKKWNKIGVGSAGTYNTGTNYDRWSLQRLFINFTTRNKTQTKAVIDQAYAAGAWLIIGCHSYEFTTSSLSDETSMTTQNLKEIFEYAKTKGSCFTVKDAWDRRKEMFNLLNK